MVLFPFPGGGDSPQKNIKIHFFLIYFLPIIVLWNVFFQKKTIHNKVQMVLYEKQQIIVFLCFYACLHPNCKHPSQVKAQPAPVSCKFDFCMVLTLKLIYLKKLLLYRVEMFAQYSLSVYINSQVKLCMYNNIKLNKNYF